MSCTGRRVLRHRQYRWRRDGLLSAAACRPTDGVFVGGRVSRDLAELTGIQGAARAPEYRAARIARIGRRRCRSPLDDRIRPASAGYRAAAGAGVYTLAGGNPILDDTDDRCALDAPYHIFEMEHLMEMGEKYATPVLLYLFHCIERNLDGAPTLLVLDEAWLMLRHPLFQEKIRAWLKTLRKAN